MSPPRTSQELRAAWLDFFAARGHTVVPSASVIPVDKTILFTVAGMVPFKPYFTGDEKPPFLRAASIQRTIRAGGKHNDLDDIGRTNRHFSFFEMLGNFSFGDYFKREAIVWAWELVTDVLAIDPGRLWVTVHDSDDEAEALWISETDVPAARVQRLGEANLWNMGDTGPCGPSSELFFDLGPEHGPEGGPAIGGEDRFVEIWNLVFMQYDQRPDGEQVPLPRRCIDTGAGLERLLAALQGKASAWDTDAFAPLVATAADVTGATYGRDEETDVSLRIIADHARSLAVMVSDGVVPSNEERGYVVRRIIRRAVRHAYRVGAREHVTPTMIDAVVHALGTAYPDLVQNHPRIVAIAEREEARFLDTLQRGLDMLDDLLAKGDVSGHDAFFLHDTLGFPVDLTREIAEERGRRVDLDTFTRDMAEQRRRAREAHREAGGAESAPVELYREIVEEHGPTVFTGRDETSSIARVLAIVDGGERVGRAGEGDEVDVVLDRTPFYAESGGQIGDTGGLRTAGDDGAVAHVLDTQYGLPQQLHVHRVRIRGGELREGDDVVAAIDAERRDGIRRHHTATHLLHWALRQVLGESAQQAGSLVAPDRLRFDFSHHEPVSRAQLDEIEALVNQQVLSDAPVRHYETTKDDAFAKGALAFFGEKYGDTVRVLEAGEASIELCGGTHVPALGFIGPVKIVSEGSIGSNLRRIEAVAGEAALERINDEERTLRTLADLLRASPAEVETKVQRLVEQVRSLQQELDATRAKAAVAEAADLASGADDGVVVARRDGLDAESLGRLAQATVQSLGTGIVGVVGASSDATKAGLAVAVSRDLQARGVSAADVARPAVRALGGGTGKSTDLVVGGGKNVDAIDDALELLAKSATEGVS
jgi:alanyl-tRNA synthetase